MFPPELIAAIVGPVVGAIFGLTGFMSRRSFNITDKQLDEIKETIELVSHQVTSLQINFPVTYATKEELLFHATKDDNMDNQILKEIQALREEVIVLKTQFQSDHHNNAQ